MLELGEGQMLQEAAVIRLKRRNIETYIHICVDAYADGEVIGLGEDLDAKGEGALSSDMLLEGSGGGAATIDFSVIEGGDEQGIGEF